MKKKYLKPIAWIAKLYWSTSKPAVLWIAFRTIFDGLIGIAITYISAMLLSSISAVAFSKGSKETVYFWIFVTLIIGLISEVMRAFDNMMRRRSDDRIEIAAVEHMASKVYELSQEQFDNQEFNTKFERARSSFYELTRSIETFSSMVSSLIALTGSIIAILVVSPFLGIFILAALVPSVILERKTSVGYEKLYRDTAPLDRTEYRIRDLLTDPIFMPEIRLMQAFKDLLNIWRVNKKKSQDISFEAGKSFAKNDILSGAITTFMDTAAEVILFNLLFGKVIGFDRFIFLRGMVAQAKGNVSSLSYSIKRVFEGQIALANYSEVFNTKPAILNGDIKPKAPLTIEFKDVSFHYPNSEAMVIDGMSFIITPGEKIALVGENGAGKTTIVKLMLRQYLPTSGSILVNGIDIANINQDDYLRAMCSLTQEFHTIETLSIRDNLTLGMGRAITNDEIYEVTDLVDATKFLKKLPHKLSSRLDPSFEKGTNLSGGQKQRLGIARTLLRNGDIMILDEPTSAIDAKAEYFIFNNIFEHHAGKTTLIISHRFSTVRRANKIIVIESGKIIESGTHEELLALRGTYQEMFERQAEGYR